MKKKYEPIEPKTYTEAMRSPERDKWTEAINVEVDSLLQNGTWQHPVQHPFQLPQRSLKAKWVFKIKYKDGKLDRFKARLVAKGFLQREGIDYHETFAPVVNYTALRLVLAIAARYDLDLEHVDIDTASLMELWQWSF